MSGTDNGVRSDGRELRLYLEEGADPPSLVAEPAERKDGFSAEYIEGFYDTRVTPRSDTSAHQSTTKLELRRGAVA